MCTNIAATLMPLSQPPPDYIIVTGPSTMNHYFVVHNICNIHMLSNLVPTHYKIHFFLTHMYLLLQLCKAQTNRQWLNSIIPQKAPLHLTHKPLLLQQLLNRISFVYGTHTPGVCSTLSSTSCATTLHIRLMLMVHIIAEWPMGSHKIN